MELHNIRSEAKGLTTWGCMWKQGECPTDTQQRAGKYFICQGKGIHSVQNHSILAGWFGEMVCAYSRCRKAWKPYYNGAVRYQTGYGNAESC